VAACREGGKGRILEGVRGEGVGEVERGDGSEGWEGCGWGVSGGGREGYSVGGSRRIRGEGEGGEGLGGGRGGGGVG